MRVIGGTLRGRKFFPPAKKWPTRPTTDISKEGLYNILNNHIYFDEVKFLDLFGGTGNHCYEFTSRGCTNATYVDKFPDCVKFVKKTSKEFGVDEYIRITRMDVFKFVKMTKEKYTCIFAGPPYGLPTIDSIPNEIFHNDLLSEDGIFVMEHNPNHNYENHPNFVKSRNYGETIFSFFEHK